MVISKIFGGLGNQIFQYAFGKKMALLHNCDLKLDLSFFANDNSRKFALNCFKIDAENASQEEIDYLKHKQNLQSDRWSQFFKPKPYFIHQKEFQFSPIYFKTRKDVYIDGYWQSEDFFSDKATQIREDLRFNIAASFDNTEILTKIQACNAISIHIRRGDFLSEQFINIHGVCSLNYYQEAMRLVATKINEPVFFVFSDDIDWARKNLDNQFKTFFVNANDEATAYEDLRLMASCQHHILANSSFSWWGAWLNENIDKIIIAPKNWFADQELNQASKSITPKSWIRI